MVILQAKAEICPPLGHDHLLPNLFRFIMQILDPVHSEIQVTL
jgi:hypothetical protein